MSGYSPEAHTLTVATACDISLGEYLGLQGGQRLEVDTSSIISTFDNLNPNVSKCDTTLLFTVVTPDRIREIARNSHRDSMLYQIVEVHGGKVGGISRPTISGSSQIIVGIDGKDSESIEVAQKTSLHEIGHTAHQMSGDFANDLNRTYKSVVHTARRKAYRASSAVCAIVSSVTALGAYNESHDAKQTLIYTGIASLSLTSLAYKKLSDYYKDMGLIKSRYSFYKRNEKIADEAMALDTAPIIYLSDSKA